MNNDESAGGSSSRGQENGDASNGSERPLKKARFPWQVKGKYHLKNDTSDQPKTSTESTDPPAIAGSSGSGNHRGGNHRVANRIIYTEQDRAMLSEITKKSFNTLDPDMADQGDPHHNPRRTNNFQYPRLVRSQVPIDPRDVLRIDIDDEMESVPMSLVPTECNTEDQCIARWQARQMTRGIVDNTVNRVLDSWVNVPVPAEHQSTRNLALDVADFVNNLPSDNSVENEGILMAISAHGLQNPDFDLDETPDFSTLEFCLSPFNSDDEGDGPVKLHHTCGIKPDDYASFRDAARLSYQFLTENLRNQQNNMDTEADELNNDESFDYLDENQNNSDDGSDDAAEVAIEEDNHCDFLDAAVLYAIQNRGLTTFESDYG
uniref:Uncharacterized protein n=1 Tax=Heliothis virescens TaxID=7102 RepID=A0A2A4J9K2_HELVI